MVGFLTAAGTCMGTLRGLETGKRPRRMVYRGNLFEQHLMQRDFRLTGYWRGQSQEPTAPERFKTSSTWNVIDKRRRRWTFNGYFGGQQY
ncbi:hypothetical protein BABINDRAFT_163363 [Babjeviella inositovora NRRL Y-12698]|uniref:NADH dehydrogenase [ubiquinone] 1 alpha subcomplex subunit 1 n=1 Tax=Babjeviella inositovora NRRL Y-12698 TaxID=984486 RepID=A0A1E3QKX5_9ASCO|nr:uncharacterized protein BABINDRAFT_163363 [Babjeviella inositovora NRRL Y-12698]ODQ77647.1 hypothetical protein BABINDRAFT_163363 [Babjeviella inositovora NRRL Y-12698]